MEDFYDAKILIVDDNEDNIELIDDFLDDEGYENILSALSAKEAYDTLSHHNVSLIILDVMMPDINGIEACKYIKSHPNYKDIPIIIATAKTDLETLKAGFEAGANDYVRKPITNDVELLVRVKNALILKSKIDYIKNINISLDAKIQQEVEKNHKIDILMQEQTKLAAMGEMIGSIAHQWRQPLNALNINIENLDDDFEDGLIDKDFIDEFIVKNKKIINFMSHTIDDFRNFFRIDKQKDNFSVLEAINSVLNIQNAIFRNYNIDIEVDGEDFVVYGFKNEFSQVIMNLLNNSKDAIVEKGIENGKIKIELSKDRVLIVDNGGGIRDDVLHRIFEPYFTTKEQGKGTGMGLYMSKVIIEKNLDSKLNVKNVSDGVSFEIIIGR